MTPSVPTRRSSDLFLGVAGQEPARLGHYVSVVGRRDALDAGRRAAFDLVHEAGPRAGRIDGIAAGTQQEGALQRGDGAVDRAGRGEGAEVVTLAVVGAAMLGDRKSVV